MDTLDVRPLIDAVDARGGIGAVSAPLDTRRRQALRRAYHRAAARGTVTARAADTLAVTLLGTHPACVFGRQWWAAVGT